MVVLRSGREVTTSNFAFGSSAGHLKSKRDLFDRVPKPTSGPPYNGPGRWRYREKGLDNPANKYVTLALNYYNHNSLQTYKLVEASGMTPAPTPSCTIFHVDFIAKKANVARAPKEMFFAELIYYMDKTFSVSLCKCMGPVGSISGDTLNGCRFCIFENVQHPDTGGFVRGEDEFYKTLQDINININTTISDEDKHMLKHDNRVPEPSEQVYDAHATEAVMFYNQEKNTNYELLNRGFGTHVILPTCVLFHINFTAKNTDVDNAPEEIFFAELTSKDMVLSFSVCASMGPTDHIPEDILRGCYYCRNSNVRHPIRKFKFVRGGDSLYKEMPKKKMKREPDLITTKAVTAPNDLNQC